MALLAACIPAIPLVAALLSLTGWRTVLAWAGPGAAAASLAGAMVLATSVPVTGPVTAVGGLIRVDGLSAYLLLVIAVVALVATTYELAHSRAAATAEHPTTTQTRLTTVLIQVFIAAMLLAVSTDNLGIMWVSVEATTIATAFLVGQRGTPASVEASWKYVVVASVGVMVAFLGTVLVYFASHAGFAEATLRWSELVLVADGLDPGVMRLAAGLLVLGLGAKAGLAPLHTWLPDAHSQAPAPVSALMSGVLLAVAFYGLLRYKVVIDAALGPTHFRGLLLVAGLGSVAVAAVMMLNQADYKRLLAYSSIEHMGLAAAGAAIGTPLALSAVLLHLLGHGLAKAVVFCSSGELLADYRSTRIADVRGVLAHSPLLGGTFGLGLLALLGMPPFSLFSTELAILRAGADAGDAWLTATLAVLLLIVFAAIAWHGQRLLLGPSPTQPVPRWRSQGATAPLVVALIACAALGVTVSPIAGLLASATAVVAP